MDTQVKLRLVPSLGYFGGAAIDCLHVGVAADVVSIRLSPSSARPTYINLTGLELIGTHGRIVPQRDEFEASQSSVQLKNDGRKNEALLEKKGIHSQKELHPWWEVNFKRPQAIQSLRIFNRPDGWGCRSQTLTVQVTVADGQKREVYNGISDEALDEVLACASRVLGVRFSPLESLNGDTADLLRRGIVQRLAEGARNKTLTASARDWQKLVAFTGIWSADEPSDSEWTVLAAYLVAQKREAPNFATSIRTMSKVLNSRLRLERLEREVADLAAIHSLDPVMLSRHGLRPVGVLRQKAQAYLVHLEAVIEAMTSLGYDAMIAYGTLLGAVREGKFLAHDDDVDVMYVAKSSTRQELTAEIGRLKSRLRELGFRAEDLLPKHTNMHVKDPSSGVSIDLFPCWLEDGLLQMHMEGMKIRGLQPDIMLPTSRVSLEGRVLAAPGNPEGFLSERYGDRWNVADPYYDWPWKLVDA